MKKCFALATLVVMIVGQLSAQSTSLAITDWNAWETKPETEIQGRKTLVYVYTNWCSLCKKMEAEAFTDSVIQALITDQFTIVGLDAENKEPLNFKGETYEYVRKGKLGYHELAAHLLDGRLAFPSVIFLSEEGEVIQTIHAYQGQQHFEMLLRYYGEDYYRSMPWTSFQRQFNAGQITDDQ
ncbi:MAG: thioredoxin fold domain-containing protein [Bacteroidota bacterium]